MEYALTYDDVLLIPAYNAYDSRGDEAINIGMVDKTGKLSLTLPIMSANMDTITESNMANFMGGKGGIGVMHRFMDIERNVVEYKRCQHPVFVSFGVGDHEFERVEALKQSGATYFCLDVAHAHARYVGKMLKRVREILTSSYCVMAGNVATYAGADYLASCGVDIIKCGIGSGSLCTTRIVAAHGVPSLTAIKECSRVNRSIVADGGIRTSGDIIKALAFGADYVMIGNMLSGTCPTPGDVVCNYCRQKHDSDNLMEDSQFGYDGNYYGYTDNSYGYDHRYQPVKSFRGMASKEVNEEKFGKMPSWKTAEGVATTVPYREDEDEIIAKITGGLRSGLTYSGSCDIKEMQRKLNYCMVTQAGRVESLPHKLL